MDRRSKASEASVNEDRCRSEPSLPGALRRPQYPERTKRSHFQPKTVSKRRSLLSGLKNTFGLTGRNKHPESDPKKRSFIRRLNVNSLSFPHSRRPEPPPQPRRITPFVSKDDGYSTSDDDQCSFHTALTHLEDEDAPLLSPAESSFPSDTVGAALHPVPPHIVVTYDPTPLTDYPREVRLSPLCAINLMSLDDGTPSSTTSSLPHTPPAADALFDGVYIREPSGSTWSDSPCDQGIHPIYSETRRDINISWPLNAEPGSYPPIPYPTLVRDNQHVERQWQGSKSSMASQDPPLPELHHLLELVPADFWASYENLAFDDRLEQFSLRRRPLQSPPRPEQLRESPLPHATVRPLVASPLTPANPPLPSAALLPPLNIDGFPQLATQPSSTVLGMSLPLESLLLNPAHQDANQQHTCTSEPANYPPIPYPGAVSATRLAEQAWATPNIGETETLAIILEPQVSSAPTSGDHPPQPDQQLVCPDPEWKGGFSPKIQDDLWSATFELFELFQLFMIPKEVAESDSPQDNRSARPQSRQEPSTPKVKRPSRTPRANDQDDGWSSPTGSYYLRELFSEPQPVFLVQTLNLTLGDTFSGNINNSNAGGRSNDNKVTIT